MKEIKAYVRPGSLSGIIGRLEEEGARDLAVTHVDEMKETQAYARLAAAALFAAALFTGCANVQPHPPSSARIATNFHAQKRPQQTLGLLEDAV
jgi:hypothetical protein